MLLLHLCWFSYHVYVVLHLRCFYIIVCSIFLQPFNDHCKDYRHIVSMIVMCEMSAWCTVVHCSNERLLEYIHVHWNLLSYISILILIILVVLWHGSRGGRSVSWLYLSYDWGVPLDKVFHSLHLVCSWNALVARTTVCNATSATWFGLWPGAPPTPSSLGSPALYVRALTIVCVQCKSPGIVCYLRTKAKPATVMYCM